MKRLFVTCLLFLFSFSSCKTNTNPDSNVNQAIIQDYALVFSDNEKESLSSKIIDYEAVSSNEICIYTIDSLPRNTNAIFYATNIANTLGVGKKEKDNGLLILISKYDRQLAIATGNSTKRIITDAVCQNIIDKTIITRFKETDYFEGVNNALDSIIKKW